jgi:hypothetical protein
MAKTVSEAEYFRRLAKKTGQSPRQVKEFIEAQRATIRPLVQAGATVRTPLGDYGKRKVQGGQKRVAPNGRTYITKSSEKLRVRLRKKVKAYFGL